MGKKQVEARQRAHDAKVRRQSALEQVRRAWQDQQPRAGITLHVEDVHSIAWRLIQGGVQPTNDAIRFVHGSGSPNMIAPALRSFFAGELQRRYSTIATPGMSEEAVAAWAILQREGERVARERMAEDQASLDDQAAIVSARLDVLDQREQRLEMRDQEVRAIEAGWKATQENLERTIARWQADLEQARDDVRQQREFAEERIRQLEGEIDRLRREIGRTQTAD